MTEPIALQIQTPQFDLGGTLMRVAQIRAAEAGLQNSETHNALGQLQLQQAGDQRGALSAFRAATEAGDPNAIRHLTGFPELQSHAIKAQAATEEARNERLARDAQYIKGFAGDPGQFSAAWKQRLDAANQRRDMPPLMYAQLSQLPQPPKELLDSLIQRGAKIPSRLDEAHAGYYEAAADARKTIAGAVSQNSDTRRLKAYGDILEQFGQTPPSREVWDREMQNDGGLLRTAFGGRVIPYEQAPQAWMEIKSRMAAGPEDQDMVDAGLSPDEIQRAKQQRVLQNTYGKLDAKTGKRWTPSGGQVDIPGANRDTQNERQSRIIAKAGLNNIDAAEKYLSENGGIVGGIKQIAGDEWRIPRTAMSVGGLGEAGRAFKAARMGIIDLNFALSGKSVSNAERTEFLNLYLPHATDSRTTPLWKLGRAKQYFNVVLQGRNEGKSEEEIADIYRRAINDGAKGPGDNPPPKSEGRLPAGRNDPRSLSDDELLRRLQQ